MTNPSAPHLLPEAALAELGRIVLRETTTQDVLQRVAELAKASLPGVLETSVTLLGDARGSTVAVTGALAQVLDERQYAHGYGPCVDAARGGEAMEIEDARTETRWPAYVVAALDQGALSSLSVPLPVQKEMTAALNCYAEQPHAFDAESRRQAAAFAGIAGVVVSNMHSYDSVKVLAEQMQTAMVSRAVVDQAKGILMGERRCTAKEAFDLLVALSQSSHRKLRDVAQALVDEAPGPR